MRTIAFTGTQKGMTDAQIVAVSALLLSMEPERVVHGDCIGADSDFDVIVRRQPSHIFIDIHPADGEDKRAHCELRASSPGQVTVHEPKPPLDRNHDMVDMGDSLIATPKGFKEEIRSGTWATVRYARKCKKPVIIVWPDGSITKEENL